MFRQFSLSGLLLKDILVEEVKYLRGSAYHFGNAVLEVKKVKELSKGCSRQSSAVYHVKDASSSTLKHNPSLKCYESSDMGADTPFHRNPCNGVWTRALTCQLKASIPEEKPIYILIEKFLIAFHSTVCHSEVAGELLSFLLDIDESEVFKSNEEYVKRLIKASEYLTSSYSEGNLYSKFCSRYPLGNLNSQKRALFHSAIDEADWMLDTAFGIGREHPDYSKNDRRVLAKVVLESIKVIESCILYINYLTHFKLEGDVLHKESSPKLPTDSKFSDRALLEQFYTEKIKNSVEILESFTEEYEISGDELDIEECKEECIRKNECKYYLKHCTLK